MVTMASLATGLGKKAPVCKVCNDESSGFHYGVDSCEGCKGFFRRCITQGMHHRCNNSEKCEITPFTRNSCQYCRLKKCFTVGMSREASRLGRRPKKMKELGVEGVKVAPLQGNPFFDLNVFDSARIFETVKAPMSDTRSKLITIVTQAISDAHFLTCSTTFEAVEEKITSYNQKKALSSLGEFEQIDVDPNLMWQQFVAHMVPQITMVVKFCKKLPGFKEITQDDQILLIKQGSFEVLLIRFLNLIDQEEMFDPGMSIKCSREVAIGMPLGAFFDEFFKIADKFNPLTLTDVERGLFAAVTIMCPDRKSLHNRKNVAKIQSLFFHALYHLLCINHSDPDSVFQDLLNIIPLLRMINEQHWKALNNMKMMSPQTAQGLPALHQEVFDINT